MKKEYEAPIIRRITSCRVGFGCEGGDRYDGDGGGECDGGGQFE